MSHDEREFKPKFRSTKEALLTPRECPSCNRWMTREFLEERRQKQIERSRGRRRRLNEHMQ